MMTEALQNTSMSPGKNVYASFFLEINPLGNVYTISIAGLHRRATISVPDWAAVYTTPEQPIRLA